MLDQAASAIDRIRGRSKGAAPPIVKTGLPFVGPAAAYQRDPLAFLIEARRRYGEAFTVDLLLQRLTFVTSPEAQREFFLAENAALDFDEGTNQFSQAIVGPMDSWGRLRDVSIGNGIIRRGLMVHERLDAYVEHIEAECRRTFATWERLGTVDLFPAASRLVNHVNIRAFMGPRVREEFGDAIADAYYEIETHGVRPESIAFPRVPSRAVRVARAARARIGEIVERVMRDTRFHVPGTYLHEVLSSKFPDGTTIRPDELRAHLVAVMFAAHTNTAGTFAWTLARLLADPGVLDRVRKEQSAFRERNGDAFTFQSVRQLELLDACMKEAVRLHFTLILLRKTAVPWRVGPYVIPRGELIAVSPILLHLDESIFPSPHDFLPDRFLDANRRRDWVRSGAYVQFGQGPHRCLGEMFANVVLKTAWSILLRDHECSLRVAELPPPDWSKALGTPFASAPVPLRVRPHSG